jgi:membrane protease YdiL (CAAX protease family)
MKLIFKILGLYLLTPLLSFLLIIILHLFWNIKGVNTNSLFSYLWNVTCHIAIIVMAVKINVVKIDLSKIRAVTKKQMIITFFLCLMLFLICYVEFSFLIDFKKPRFDYIDFVYSVIFASILEEFFFKKIIFENLILSKINPYLAIFTTALLFSLSHLPNVYITHFLGGFATTFIYFKNKNLTQSILIHSFYNLLLNTFYLI